MNERISGMSIVTLARIAGILYLTLIISGIFAEFFVRQSLVVDGDPTTTAANIMASEGFFRIGIAADVVMILADIALALIFYVLLKAVNDSLSLLAAFFRLIQASVLGINLLNLFIVLQLLSGTQYLATLDPDRLNALVMLFLKAHGTGYSIGLIFFGIHCFILGYLLIKSGYVPKILGVLIIIASIGYLIDSFANVLMVNYGAYETVFALVVFIPAIIGELALCLWLLIRGIRVPEKQS